LVGGLLGKWLRRRVALALIVYALYQWWLAREHVGQEVKSFKAFLDALE